LARVNSSNDKILGTWKLVSVLSLTTTAVRDEAPFGANPSGFLTYTDDGRVSVVISYGGRKHLSGLPSPQEQAEAFKTFLAYAGRYTFDGQQITHHVEVSSIQNFVNRDLVRTVKFEDDRIVLVAPPSSVNGKIQTVELTWGRAK
jgi:hypothetical protein